jgi:hypothetical protein
MSRFKEKLVPKDLLSDLEQRFFWWEPVVSEPRSDVRILAQAMSLGRYEDIRQLENVVGFDTLVLTMLNAQPGWISDQSWDFWRGRLSRATRRNIADTSSRRSFDAGPI